jgi:hypothetical protein
VTESRGEEHILPDSIYAKVCRIQVTCSNRKQISNCLGTKQRKAKGIKKYEDIYRDDTCLLF